MKSFTPFALGTLIAVAAAVPLEKRDYATTTIIENVIETVDVYTTVYVPPGDPRLQQNQLVAPQTSSSSASAPSTLIQSSSAAGYIPEQKKEAAYIAPASTSTPAQVPSVAPSSTPAAVAKPEVLAVAPVSAPSVTPSSTPAAIAKPEVLAVAPVASSSAPVPSPSTSPGSTSNSGPSGGACGEIMGKCTASDMTTFDGTVGLGSCGWMSPAKSPYYVALAHEMMGAQSNGNPYCGRTIKISANGQTYDAILTDKCPGCDGQSLDLSIDLFNKVFPTAKGTGRFHGIDWWFTS